MVFDDQFLGLRVELELASRHQNALVLVLLVAEINLEFERPLKPEDFPGAPPENLVPGSMVFRKTAGPVDPRKFCTFQPASRGELPLCFGGEFQGIQTMFASDGLSLSRTGVLSPVAETVSPLETGINASRRCAPHLCFDPHGLSQSRASVLLSRRLFNASSAQGRHRARTN
jgi:hypothetical protein